MRKRAIIASLLALIMVLGASPRGMAAPVPRTIQVGQNAACDFHNNDWDYDPYGITSHDDVHGDPAFVGFGNDHLTEPSAAINQGTN